MSVDIHAAISMLRYLSEEFREARRIPSDERQDIAESIGMRASKILLECWELGYLRSIPSLQQQFDDLKSQEKKHRDENSEYIFLSEVWFEMQLFSHLVGYRHAVVEDVSETSFYHDNGECIEYENLVKYLSLKGGILAKDGLLLTPDILLGQVPMSDGEIASAAGEHAFEVLGYYAQGCEVLASIIEREKTLSRDGGKSSEEHSDQEVQTSLPDDGFSEDGRTFRWCGESYSLRESPSKVVKVLYDAYMRGTQFMHEQYIKEESEVYSDVRTIVRDNKLSGLIIPEVDSDGKRVKGKWGLTPRTK